MSSSTASGLPEGFLTGPAPNITRTDVDFVKGGLPEYQRYWAVVLDGVFTEEECDSLIAAAEARTEGKWGRAMINIGHGEQRLYEEERKCGRIIWDSPELAVKIWNRVAPAVPDIHELDKWPDVTGIGPVIREQVLKVTQLNERMRFLKYVGGEYFKTHGDGKYTTFDGEESCFTLHLYLNSAEGKEGQEPLVGGATTFHSRNGWFSSETDRTMHVVPKAGRVLLFQQRDLLHSGADVLSGTKYTMRTDVMYMKEPRAKKETQEET